MKKQRTTSVDCKKHCLTSGDTRWNPVGRCTRKPGRMINMPEEIIVAIVYIISFWQCGDNLEPMVICSTMRANRRSVAPVEIMKHVEKYGNKAWWNIAVDHWGGEKLPSSSKYCCDKLLSPKYLLEKTSQRKNEGWRPRLDKTDFFGDPENGVTLK